MVSNIKTDIRTLENIFRSWNFSDYESRYPGKVHYFTTRIFLPLRKINVQMGRLRLYFTLGNCPFYNYMQYSA
jgi:hypothetical protein